MLIDQLGRTLRAMSDAHVARGETQTAKGLIHIVSGELHLLHDRFEKSSFHELLPHERTPDYMRNVLEDYTIGGHHIAHHHGREASHDRGFGR